MGSMLGAIGSLELLAGALLMMRVGEGKVFYLAAALAVLGFGTLLVAAELMENAVATVR